MRHISLDESFWRSAAEALVSGELLHDVEPSLLDLSRLLQLLYDAATLRPGGPLGVLTLGGSEEERTLGVTLGALLARRGCGVLLVDLDFGDDTWSRLLGSEELEGLADHLGYGTSPARLVRTSTWEGLSLLASGSGALDPAAALRSGKLRACLESLTPAYDLVCVGFPFDESLDWGVGAAACIERALLVGPSGDELAFELAIPKLVGGPELLTTVDVPPLGRWRPTLGAALPALGASASTAGSPARPAPSPGAARQRSGSPEDSRSGTGPGRLDPEESVRFGPPARERAGAFASSEEGRAAAEPASVAAGGAQDPESAADIAFLAGLPDSAQRTAEDEASRRPSVQPPSVHPRLRHAVQQQLELSPLAVVPDLRELAAGWDRQAPPGVEAPPAPPEQEESGGFWGATLTAVFLCLLLGAGAFWYWRSSRPIPEGQFTFVEPEAGPGASGPSRGAADAEGAEGAENGGEQATGEVTIDEAGAAVSEARATSGATGRAADAPDGAGSGMDAAGGELAAGENEGDDGGSAKAEAPTTPAGGLEDAADTGGSAPAAAGGETEAAQREQGAASAAGSGSGLDQHPGASLEAPAGAGIAGRAGETEAAAAEQSGFDPPKSGPVLGFSLHVGSFQSYDAAARAAASLQARGQEAFVVPVLVQGKGEWYRVFIGAMEGGAESQAVFERARSEGAVREGTVRETPWALYLGTYETPAAAASALSRLGLSGISAYAVGAGPVQVYAGAFESAADAELLNRQLQDRGFEAALVRRRAASPHAGSTSDRRSR